MSAPDIEQMIRKDLEDLKKLYLQKLPVKIGVAVRDSIRENFRQGHPLTFPAVLIDAPDVCGAIKEDVLMGLPKITTKVKAPLKTRLVHGSAPQRR